MSIHSRALRSRKLSTLARIRFHVDAAEPLQRTRSAAEDARTPAVLPLSPARLVGPAKSLRVTICCV